MSGSFTALRSGSLIPPYSALFELPSSGFDAAARNHTDPRPSARESNCFKSYQSVFREPAVAFANVNANVMLNGFR